MNTALHFSNNERLVMCDSDIALLPAECVDIATDRVPTTEQCVTCQSRMAFQARGIWPAIWGNDGR